MSNLRDVQHREEHNHHQQVSHAVQLLAAMNPAKNPAGSGAMPLKLSHPPGHADQGGGSQSRQDELERNRIDGSRLGLIQARESDDDRN